jgi:hypothetical protein
MPGATRKTAPLWRLGNKSVPSPSRTVYVTDADNREVLEYDGTSGQIERRYAFGLGDYEALSQMNLPQATRETLIPDIEGSIVASVEATTGVTTETPYLAQERFRSGREWTRSVRPSTALGSRLASLRMRKLRALRWSFFLSEASKRRRRRAR